MLMPARVDRKAEDTADSAGGRVVAFGPATGGVGGSFSHTVTHLAKASQWHIDVIRLSETGVPLRNAVGAVRVHHRSLKAADAIHVEFGSNDKTVFWFALLATLFSRSVTVVIHDFPLMVNHPAAGFLPETSRWKTRLSYRILSPAFDGTVKRMLLRRAGAVTVMSEEARHGWQKYVHGELVVIPHGEFPLSNRRLPPSEGTYVLFAGFIGPGKGVDLLLEAWRTVGGSCDLELLIAGEQAGTHDPRLETLRRQAREWSNPPRWVGYVASEEALQSLIARAAVVVLPYRRSSPASGILVRAMAEGRAIVATRVPATFRTLRDQLDGLLVPPNDAEILAAKLSEVIRDPDLRDRLGASAAERARASFSSDRQRDVLLSAYQRLQAKSRQF
jgi:glycosyltransferase involved in cell wall biosynthesis